MSCLWIQSTVLTGNGQNFIRNECGIAWRSSLPTRTTWPKPLWPPTAEQFQRWYWNCCWHSANPSLAPLLMATMASGLLEHIRRWRAVSPGIRLQIRSALIAITVDMDLTWKRKVKSRISFCFAFNRGGTWPRHLRLPSPILCFLHKEKTKKKNVPNVLTGSRWNLWQSPKSSLFFSKMMAISLLHSFRFLQGLQVSIASNS